MSDKCPKSEYCDDCKVILDGSQGPEIYRLDNSGVLWCPHTQAVRPGNEGHIYFVRQDEYEVQLAAANAKIAELQATVDRQADAISMLSDWIVDVSVLRTASGEMVVLPGCRGVIEHADMVAKGEAQKETTP